MAKFIEDRSSLKKKKKKENAQKAAPSSANKKQVSNIANQVVNRTANAAKRTTNTVGNSAQRQNTVRRNVQDSISRNAPQRYNNRPSGAAQPSTNHTVQDRLAASRQRREQAEADIKRRRQESEARSQRISQSRNARMQDTARGTKLQTEEERRQRQDRLRAQQEQKMGNNSMASKEAQKAANRAVKNTPTVVKESAKQVGIGHGKTLADITEANKSAAIGSKIDIKSKEFQEDIEKRRKESTRVAKSSFKTLSDMQEKSEQKLQDKTKDAKGLEKAYYGALESGVGMATDRLAGPAWAVSMLSRTYGNTRGQAQKEGATEDEDRAYSLLQAAKEVATEYMFQGVGLAKGLSGSKSLALGEKAANALTKNMRGPLANATHAGIRLLGGVGEENLEEVAGWGLDPFIKEFTYGRNVRTRQAQQMMREQSDALRSNITSMDDARAIAAYLGSDDFLDSQIRTYMDSGIGKEEARDLAENMRDYLDASLSGDTEKMADIEESLSKKLSGRGVKDILKQDLSLSELKDTIESTTLLTATTGLPGTVTTTARGAAIKEQLGSDGIRALAKTAEDFEDDEMQLKAKAMSDRLDAGKDITNTQAYDLAVGVQEQYNKDADRQQTAYQTAQKTIKSEKLVTPYRVSRDGDIQMDEVTDKTYQSTAKSAKSAIETFIENSDGKESLTDTEIDRGSRAIAGFKTGVFTVDDANELNFRNTAVRSAFEKETGVDLSEYVVKGKDGQIDIPATNTATKNALFAKAADNLVATAQAETANWVDNTKGEVVTQISRRMGASGTAALQTALDDVDERDRSSYMMTANASDVLYQSARNMGTEWENAKGYAKRMFPNVAEDKLKAMYEAGLADRDMATDEARGQQIKIGEKVELKKQSNVPTGQVIVETSAPVKGSVIRTFTELARNLGVDIHLVDHFTDKDGKVLKNVNGEYIDGNIYLNVNSDFEKNMGFIFMHEVTHHLKMYAPEQYKALENLVREKWFKYDSEQMQSEIAKKIETYAKHGQKLTEEQALEEIIADAAHEFLTDRNFAKEIANEDASLAQAVLTSIRNALRMLRRIMSADGLDETHMNTLFSQLDILDEAERLWLDAYKQAVRNNAAAEVDRLQNQIYEEGRMSVGYHAGDLGKSTVDDYAHQGYGRGTGHFGFGTYFVGDEEQINYGDYGKRKHETVDFDKYNLFRPTNFDQGLRLHDALKLVDGFITEYSEFNQFDRLSDEGIQNSLDNTVRINRAAETLVDDYEWEDYQWNDNSLRNKEKVDKYIAEKLDEYDRSEIERKARQRYDEEQNKKIDEESIRKELAHQYDTFKGMKDFWGDPFVSETSEEEYIQNNLEDTIRIRTENKNVPYDYYYYKEAQEAIKGETERWEWKDRRLKNLASDLQFALGFRFSEERIAEALKETERIVRGYKHDPNYSRLDVEPGLDSGATVFMKQLGYEGVDVRHISEMDNTGYGSVIYDLKDEDLARKNEIGTARFSVSEETRESLNNEGIEELADGTTARFSLTSWQETNKEKKLKALTAANHDEKTAKKWIEDIDSIASIILGDPERLDYEADRSNKFLKPNGDYYKYTLDASTLCDKRRIYQGTYNAIQHAMPDIPLMQDDVVRIRTLLKEKDHKAPCGICYVESQRKNLGAYAKEWYDNYARKDEIRLEDVTTSDGLKELKKTNPEVAADFEKAMAAKGVSSPKVVKLRTDYREDIMRMRPSTIEYLNSIGGLRFHSFSDFETPHLIDTMQAVMDMATKNLMGMAYAKVPNFAAVFGPTGIKINLSLIAKTDENGNAVHDEDGRLVFDSVEGIPYEEAKKWRDAYPDNVAFILVGKDKEHTLEAINDDRVDFVIPFHRSKWSAEDMRRLGLVGYEDFATGHQENGIFVSEFWDYNKTGKENAEKYLEVCKERGVTPIFEQLLHDNGDGTYSLQEDGSTDNYWKLLVEGKMYNHITKKGAPQQPVQPNFNMEEARRVLKEYEGGANELPVADDVVEAFVKEYKEAHPDAEIADARLSISADLDEPYMAAVNAGNMEEAQEYVEQAAERAGYTTRAYHGTLSSFTVFDEGRNRSANYWGDGFYFTSDNSEATNIYANQNSAENRSKGAEGNKPNVISAALRIRTPYYVGGGNGLKFTTEEERAKILDALTESMHELYSEEEIDNFDGVAPDFDWINDYYPDGFTSAELHSEISDLAMFMVDGVAIENNALRKLGYDSIIAAPDGQEFLNKYESTHYIVFNNTNIKSADTVTYAEDGSVIPLSERFDPTNNDIRYSMSTEDADGNVLTTDQMEFFKNSQARDKDGKLQTVYHTTNRGGFTVFDPSYSDDRRSLFFASNWNVSQTYGSGYQARKKFDLREITDSASLVDYISNGHPFSFKVLTNSEFEELGGDFAFWGDISANIGVPSYEYDIVAQKVKNRKNEFDSASALIKSYIEDVRSGAINPNDYTLLFEIPGQDPSFSRRFVSGKSFDEIVEKLGKQKRSKKNSSQAGYYKCYLNLQNPLEVDAHGSNWNKIPYGEIAPNPIREQALAKMENEAEIIVDHVSVEWDDFDDDFEHGDFRTLNFELTGKKRKQDGTFGDLSVVKSFTLDDKKYAEVATEYDTPGTVLTDEFSNYWVDTLNLSYDYLEDIMNYADGMDGSIDYSPLILNQEKAPDYITADGNKMDYAEIFEELNEESDEEYSYSPYEGVATQTYMTRELAELAEAEGYDGVIIRNCRDIGGASYLKGGNPISDIFIAFSSNQVKDTRNENPTENPDIRYSITEDEGKSKKDYDHATDMSYEELLMYEDMIANASESSDIEASFNKAFDGEKVSKFYSALTEEVGMVFDDEILEEGRMRMAKSKADFWSNLNTKWQERWVTKGEVLDTKSVKTNVRNLIRGVMNNSDTDRQYKTELVNKTLMDMRVAYQLMKQDRTDIASALLYHSALRMITDVDFVRDDTEYQEYKGIRDYLRGEPITVSDDYWQGKAFQQFRKEHYGILKLRKGANGNIGEVYAQLENLYPNIFNETERGKHGFGDSEEDLLQYIGFVTEQNMQPFTEAYSSEECAEWAFEIADDLYEIMENGEGVTSLADRYKAKYDAKAKAMKTRHAEAILRVRKQKQAAIDALKDRYNERLDRQKELAKDAIRREREKFRQQKQDEKERTKERRLHSKYFDSIVKSHKALSDRLLTNTKDKHIPEQYKKDLAELLAAFDLQTVASKKLEIRNGLYYRQNYQSQKTIRMKALQETLANIQADSQLFYVNDSITEIIDRLLGKNAEGKTDPLKSVEGRTIDELTASELKDIDKLLKALIHEFNNYESVRTGAKRQQAADIATSQIDSCLDHAGKFGEGLDYQNFLGALDNILNLDEVTPAYMFRQIDPQNNGIGMMFKELRRSFGKYVRNQNQLNEWMDEIIGEYNNKGRLWNKYGSALEEWRISTRAKEFQLTNGNVKLTPAQMMSIYCLSHRQQAYDHMTGAGIVVQPVSFQAKMASDLRKRANYALPVILTDSDIKLITSKLTPDQIKVADKLQELMATKMAEWGNEASMSVMGIRLFEDPDYFPIKSDKAALEKDFSAEQFMDCIRNFGFTKAVQPGARNAIAIGDIFDVVAEHCNNMNLYNAYSESMSDFMKVYNYHALREDGSDYSVEEAIAHAYSKKATTFIGTFMKDLNGNVSKERTTGIEQMMNDSLGKAKKASVFANGRVALQQPTALMRAFAVISPKYLKGVKAGKATMQEMFEHSPIALWKSWGYYDINMGKSIEDLMMNNGSWAEDKMSDIYGELDNRTWAVIWTMCKNEVEDKHKDVEKGSDEYWELVSERMDEVVDLTQVVDSPFHRSHAMRSKNTLVKMATAFMAEPTLTFNMLRDGFIRAKEELRLGNKKAATKIVGRTVTVFVLSASATAAAAAIWDAVRGKAPGGDDDDDEQGFFDMWFDNMIENLKDNLNPLNNIYYIKDVFSLFQGWDQRNLGLQGWKHLSDGFRQLKGEKVYSKLSWYENWLAGIGYLAGVPLKTMMNDGKAIFKMFGLSAPGFITDQLDKLDSIGSSTKDMNRGASSSTGISDPKTSSKSTAVNLWTYDNAPFRIEDGSAADNFLNHFGINLTSAEIAAAEEKKIKAEREKKVEDIKAKTAGMSGVEKDKKVWSYISSQIKKEHGDMPVSSIVEAGDYNSIYEYREMYVAAGGNTDYFDERIFDASKKAMKKSIVYNPTDAQIEAQDNIRNYLTDHGMSESELSEIAYKSYTAKELKVAFRLNDEDAIVEELTPLVRAGLSLEDFHRIYDNRNRIDLKKYKESGGKYAEKLKSMGDYNWPCNGTITSTFGHRSSPGGIGSTNHQGIDIGASMGAPVTAADGGVVVRSGWYGGYGKTVQIQHDDGTITQYSHLSWWEPKVGDVVAQGQEIGKVGSTGNSTGPHLHFGVMKNGEYVDPMDYLNKKS